MKKRTYALAALLVGLFATGAYLFWPDSQESGPELVHRLGFESIPDFNTQQGADRRSASAWKAAEREFYSQVVASGSFDVLVVPFEPFGDGLPRPMLSLMTAEFSAAIAASSGLKVPDPYLVARALGDGDRRHPLEEVYRLANRLNVKRIVWCMAGQHPKKAARTWGLSVQVQFQDRNRDGVLDQAQQASSALLQQNLAGDSPLDTFEALIPGMLKVLGLEPAEPVVADAAAKNLTALPANPSGLLAPSGSAAQDAYVFQLLALLAQISERTRERLMEKSLLAASRLPRTASASRVLRARALAYLGYRPAARDILGEPKTPEENQLRAKLDGNLPDAVNATAAITGPLPRLIAQLETNEFAAWYGARDRAAIQHEVESWGLPGEIWPFLVARSALDADGWTQFENLPFKYVLDREFPLADFTAEGIVRGSASIDDPEGMQARADLSVLEHVRRLTRAKAAEWCCNAFIPRPHALDYLELLESIGTTNLVRTALFQLNTQGSPESALELVRRYDRAYRGHPKFVLVRAFAERKIARRSDGTARQGQLASAYEAAYNVLFWEQGPTITAADALALLSDPESAQYVPTYDPYANDKPVPPYYPASQNDPGALVRSRMEALENSMTDFTAVERLFYVVTRFNTGVSAEAVLKMLDGRFIGHRKRPALVAEHEASAGQVELAEKHYREALALEGGNWAARQGLATLLFENARVEEAARVFSEYPGFEELTTEHRVGVANYASEAGNPFFWSGHFDLARPFYGIAAALETGADSSLSSAIRLNLLKGNMRAAFEGSLGRARRYNSSYAYRDYLCLLHALGQSGEAWQAFDLLAAQIDKPHVWESALVGHRLAGRSEAEIATWAQRDLLRSVGATLNYSAMYLVRAALMDRAPSAELPDRLATVDRSMWRLLQAPGQVVRSFGDGRGVSVLGPDNGVAEGMLPLAIDELGPEGKERVPSDLDRFVRAHAFIRSGDAAAATAEFEQANRTLELRQPQLQYLLPYFAFAAARSKQTSTIEAILESMPPPHQRFDHLLAKGIIAAIGGDHVRGQQLLKTALLRRPYTEARPVHVEYQYAELCEWLFGVTKNAAYRDLALSWARSNQVFQPWHAWAYAVEAKLAPRTNDRRRAIAMTHYLDPKSERLASLPKAEVEAAVRQYRGRLPFPAANSANPAKDERT